MEIARRDFLKSAPAGAWILAQSAESQTRLAGPSSRMKLEPFNYRGVRLHDSRWQAQVQAARNFYFNIANDDILQGFRTAAGLPAPGKPLGSEWSSRMGRASWCQTNSATVLGQWLSGMARMSLATGDASLREKAAFLMTEWGKTIKPDGNCGMQHYPFEKLVCGLVDMQEYASHPAAMPLLENVFRSESPSRQNLAAMISHSGVRLRNSRTSGQAVAEVAPEYGSCVACFPNFHLSFVKIHYSGNVTASCWNALGSLNHRQRGRRNLGNRSTIPSGAADASDKQRTES